VQYSLNLNITLFSLSIFKTKGSTFLSIVIIARPSSAWTMYKKTFVIPINNCKNISLVDEINDSSIKVNRKNTFATRSKSLDTMQIAVRKIINLVRRISAFLDNEQSRPVRLLWSLHFVTGLFQEYRIVRGSKPELQPVHPTA